MTERLTTTSYAVLAQVAVHPWSTYELAQQRIRYFRYVWPRAESAIYREVKRLSAMGLLDGKKEHVGKRARTVYSITESGRKALREWLATPVSPFAMDFGHDRLFVAPLGTKEQIVTTLTQVRDDAWAMLRFGGEVKQEFLEGIAVTQDQVYIRALAVDFFISLLRTVEGGRSARSRRSNRGTTSAPMERTNGRSRRSGNCRFPRPNQWRGHRYHLVPTPIATTRRASLTS